MDSETEKTNPNITWEIIEPGRLPKIIDQTLEETIVQDVSVANVASELLLTIPQGDRIRRTDSIKLIQQTTARAIERIRNLQDILRKDPTTTPVPIDHRYESSGGPLIIALDLVGNPPE